eukprot:6198588-Pleurochrysis_carterae.AAC.2
MQLPQPCTIMLALSPSASNDRTSTDPTITVEAPYVAPQSIIYPPTASTAAGPARRLRSTGHVTDPRGLFATVRHINNFDNGCLPLAKMNSGMMPCLHTRATRASDVSSFPRIQEHRRTP